MAYLEFFPPEFIALNEEITHHPPLMDLLQNHPQKEFEVLLAQICHYCNIAIDGIFDEKDLVKIAEMCTERLRGRRVGIVMGVDAALEVQDIVLPSGVTKH